MEELEHERMSMQSFTMFWEDRVRGTGLGKAVRNSPRDNSGEEASYRELRREAGRCRR